MLRDFKEVCIIYYLLITVFRIWSLRLESLIENVKKGFFTFCKDLISRCCRFLNVFGRFLENVLEQEITSDVAMFDFVMVDG